MAAHPLGQRLFLFGGSELKELLDDVVPEDVGHKAVGGGEDLTEHHYFLSRGGTLKLLLDEPAQIKKEIA